MTATMGRGWRIRTCLLLLCLVPPVAWGQGSVAGTITVYGQVYGPDGRPFKKPIRLELKSELMVRPSEYVYTDSEGRFTMYNIVPETRYTLYVEGDDETYLSGETPFRVSGPRPQVRVYLTGRHKPPGTRPPGDAVSVAALKVAIPPEALAEFEAATSSLRADKVQEARQHLERALEIFPDYVDARNELAILWMRENRFEEAEVHLRRALETDSGAVRPMFNLGLCLHRRQRFADAVPYLEKALQLEPSNVQGQLQLGMTLFMADDLARAEPALSRAYMLGGKDAARAQYYLARIYLQRKDYARAAAALETYLKDNPEDPNAAQLRGKLIQIRAASPQ